MTQQVLQPSEEKTVKPLQIRIESEGPGSVIQISGKLTSGTPAEVREQEPYQGQVLRLEFSLD